MSILSQFYAKRPSRNLQLFFDMSLIPPTPTPSVWAILKKLQDLYGGAPLIIKDVINSKLEFCPGLLTCLGVDYSSLYCVMSTVKIRPDIVFPHCLLFLGLCSTNMASMMYVQQFLFILNKLNVFFLYRVKTTLFFKFLFNFTVFRRHAPKARKFGKCLFFVLICP